MRIDASWDIIIKHFYTLTLIKRIRLLALFAQEIKEFNDRSTQKCALIIHKTSRFYGKVTIQ